MTINLSNINNENTLPHDEKLNGFIDLLRNKIENTSLNNLLPINSIADQRPHLFNDTYSFPFGVLINKDQNLYSGNPVCVNRIFLEFSISDEGSQGIYKIILSDNEKFFPKNIVREENRISIQFEIDKITSNITFQFNNENIELFKVGVYGFEIKKITNLCETLNEVDRNIISNAKYLKSKYRNIFNDEKSKIKHIKIEIQNELEKLNTNKERLTLQEEQLKENNEYISQTQTTLDNLKLIVNDSSKRNEELNNKNNKLNQKLIKIEECISSAIDELNKKEEENKKISFKIKEIKKELEIYKKESNIYSTELKDFKLEIIKQNRTYLFYVFIFILTMSIISGGIYYSSMQYIAIFSSPEKIDLIQLLLSRSPLILLNIGLIALYSKILMILIPNIIDNNKQLSKVRQLEFLVKESVCSLDLSHEDTIKYKMEYKMKIIREALNIGESNNKEKKEESDKSVINLDKIMKECKEIKELFNK